MRICVLAGKTTRTKSHANLILGSTECKNVVGDDMNWQMGLEVAPAIDFKTFSAEKTFLGNHFSQFPVPPPSSMLAEQLVMGLSVCRWMRVIRGLTNEGFRVLEEWREERKGNVRVGRVWGAVQPYIG